ncbi:MAG: hypothetical protein MJ078_06110, partial [Clostridia bacterium]|nr:hypothetical protein [Clostridia bacterium]
MPNATKTVKIQQVAKDFKMQNKDFLALLAKVGIGKKTGTLEMSEWDAVLQCITLDNQIENLSDYLDGKATLLSEKPEPALKEEEKKEPVVSETEKSVKKGEPGEKTEPVEQVLPEAKAKEPAKQPSKTVEPAKTEKTGTGQIKPAVPKPKAPEKRPQKQALKTIEMKAPVSGAATETVTVKVPKSRVVDTRTTT